jgi:hypothetical protein
MSVPGGNAANRCPFGATTCTCGGNNTWACVTPIMCPATQPATADACTPVAGGAGNNTCPFGAVNCVCAAAGGAAPAWTCM